MSEQADNPIAETLVSIKTLIPEDAMSAGLLGTERTGHGVRIREDGTVAFDAPAHIVRAARR